MLESKYIHAGSDLLLNLYKPRVLFCGTYVNSGDPAQMPQNAASDQGLHCLLTECSITI